MPAASDTGSDPKAALSDLLVQSGKSGSGEVLIAGGGIGGLAAALALAKRGIACHVLERRAAFSEQGAGIQIGPNGTRILRDLGVAEALRPHAGAPQWLIVHEAARGRELARLPLNAGMESRFGSPYWVVHREDLHAALLMQVRAAAKVRISMDADIVHAASNDAAAGVALRNGDCLAGAVLVGADGLRSQVRAAIGEAGDLVPVGKSAFRAVVPASEVDPQLLDGGTHIWLARNAHVVHYTLRGGTEVAIVLIVDDAFAGEGWSHEADPRSVLAKLGFAALLRETLSAATGWRKWALVGLETAPRMASGRIALLGDAAHPVMPFLAQGGVLALEDAVVLAQVLASGERTTPDALQAYERLRRPRAQRIAGASRRNGRIYHLGGLAAVARNASLRLVPGQRLMAGYDWIYGWTGGPPK
ncbi:MAG: FAD-dependent monooxygenase [Hyphomicrobiaceae bacterium]|nr:FAD-dependent monooxygenase [Hyphomicrobiaceae bacterium]